MFFFRTQSAIVETPPDAALSLTFTNPAFDTQERAFSLPFVAVGEVENAQAELVIDGLPLMQGNVEAVRSKRKVTECAFKSEPTKISEIFAELKVNEILPTVDVFAGINTSSFSGVILQPTSPNTFFRIKVKNQVFELTYSSAPVHQQVAADFVTAINAAFPGFATLLTGAIYQVQFKNIAVYDSFNIEWSALANVTMIAENYPADFQETAIRNKFAEEQEEFVLPLIQNAFVYNLLNPAYQYYINNNQNGVITENTWHAAKECEHTFCPQVRFAYILRKALDIVETKTGKTITLLTAAPHEQTIEELTLFNLVTIDNFQFEPHTTGTGVYKNAYARLINLNNHVPDMTVKDLIEAVCEVFQLYTYYENGLFAFKSKRDQFEMGVMDMSNSIDNRVEKEYKTPEGFTLAFAKDPDEPFTQDTDLVVGGIRRIEVKAGTVAFQVLDIPMLSSQKVGTSAAFNLNIAPKTPLRLFFYKGLQTYSSIDYPFGTPLNALPDGSIDGVASLRWEGAQGLYQKAWKDVAETTYDASTITISAWLTALQIISLRNWTMPLIRFYTEGGYRKGIVKQIQTRVRLRAQTRYECELEILEL